MTRTTYPAYPLPPHARGCTFDGVMAVPYDGASPARAGMYLFD